MTTASLSEALSMLNPAQKQAAETIEGPVQVIAGPGTGKTQILAARIATILEQTDIDAWNILCLTFTEAGVVAMRNRLLSFIGPTAHKVQIHTFHSLCNLIIQDNQQFFGTSRLSAIDDIEKEEVMKKVCEKIEPETTLFNSHDPYFYKYPLESAFKTFKQENWTEETIANQVEKAIEDLRNDDSMYYKRNGKGFKKGDFKENSFINEKKKLDKIMQAAHLFNFYNAELKRMQRYDFEDMILWVIDAFKKNADLLAQYQEQFQYVLTDEFQDTNGSQFDLIRQLMGHWDNPNIFSVGDDDQSIYAFQGANVKNMLDFGTLFQSGLKEFVLTTNYRSTPQILAAAGALITNNNLRLVNARPHLSKNLSAHNEEGNRPLIISCNNPIEEASWIAQKIEEKIAQGITPNKIAILYNKHRYCNYLMRILQAKNVPVNLHRTDNIFNIQVVEFLTRVLNYVQMEIAVPFSANHELFLILHAPFLRINCLVLAEKAYELGKKKGRDKFWRIALQKGEATLFDSAPIKRAMLMIENWTNFAVNHSPISLLDKILQDAEILALFEKPGDNNESISALNSLFLFIRERNEKDMNYNLKTCVNELNLLKSSKGINVINSVKSSNGVAFVSIHSSKGLEFENVFILANTKDNWDGKGAPNGISLRPLFSNEDEKIASVEENRRLLYVAITRAEKNLYLSYFNENDNGKATSESNFISELKASELVDLTDANVPQVLLEKNNLLLLRNQAVKVQLPDYDYLKKYLDGYTLSATHLNRYLSCPVAFYYENLLRVPTAKSETGCIGTAVHDALNIYFKAFVENKAMPPIAVLINAFEKRMHDQYIYFNTATFPHKLENAKLYLSAYYEENNTLGTEQTNVVTEKMLQTMVGEAPIKGFLDKIVLDGNQAHVIDYKTGNPANAIKKMNAPVPNYEGDDLDKKYGGQYWRQMMFYYFLVNGDQRNPWKMQSAAVSCVEKDRTTGKIVPDLKLYPTKEGIQMVGGLIQDTYANIMAGKFDEGCNKIGDGNRDCQWCTFQSKLK